MSIHFLRKNGGKLENGKYAIGKIPKKMPTLTDFQKRLKERNNCNELAGLLIPFLSGNSLGIFDCESKISSDEEIINFDMSEIKDEFTKLYASFVILTWVWQKFVLKNKEKKKNCYKEVLKPPCSSRFFRFYISSKSILLNVQVHPISVYPA